MKSNVATTLTSGLIALAAATSAYAQAPAKAPAPAPAVTPAPAAAPAPATVTPEQRAAIKELLDVTKARENLGRTFAAMAQSMPAQLAQAMNMQIEQAQISPEQKQKIRQNMNQPFADAVKDAQAIVNDPKNADQALDRMYAIYAKHFTADELKQMVAFYKTPVGAKTLVEMPAVINETMQTGIGLFQPKLTALVEKTVKTQIDAANKK